MSFIMAVSTAFGLTIMKFEVYNMIKRLLGVLMLICPMIFFGCEIHFGEKRYDVHWWVILLIDAFFIVFFTILTLSLEKSMCGFIVPTVKNDFLLNAGRFSLPWAQEIVTQAEPF